MFLCRSVYLSMSLSICFCSVDREPVIQRKHRVPTSSTKSQIFFSVNPVTTVTSGPSTTTVSSSSTTRDPVSSSSVSGQTGRPRVQRAASDEYMLLGDQSKFASNVVYHVRPHHTVNTHCYQLRDEWINEGILSLRSNSVFQPGFCGTEVFHERQAVVPLVASKK